MPEIPVGNREYRIFYFSRPDGRGQLATGEVIQSAAVSVLDAKPESTPQLLVSSVTPHEGRGVRYFIAPAEGGLAPGDKATLLFTVQTSSNQTLTSELLIRVT